MPERGKRKGKLKFPTLWYGKERIGGWAEDPNGGRGMLHVWAGMVGKTGMKSVVKVGDEKR